MIPEQTLKQLCNYDWPGNIRELQNVIERAVITSRDGILTLGTLADAPASGGADGTEPSDDVVLTYEALDAFEQNIADIVRR